METITQKGDEFFLVHSSKSWTDMDFGCFNRDSCTETELNSVLLITL